MRTRGFNLPWIGFGICLAWLGDDLAHAHYGMATGDLIALGCAYLLAETRHRLPFPEMPAAARP